jgi:hypothetical protein
MGRRRWSNVCAGPFYVGRSAGLAKTASRRREAWSDQYASFGTDSEASVGLRRVRFDPLINDQRTTTSRSMSNGRRKFLTKREPRIS